ncbi:UNVERIFIED_CONTAM: hypothetical protein RMT77_017945 [Armadillidium vulgare]
MKISLRVKRVKAKTNFSSGNLVVLSVNQNDIKLLVRFQFCFTELPKLPKITKNYKKLPKLRKLSKLPKLHVRSQFCFPKSLKLPKITKITYSVSVLFYSLRFYHNF